MRALPTLGEWIVPPPNAVCICVVLRLPLCFSRSLSAMSPGSPIGDAAAHQADDGPVDPVFAGNDPTCASTSCTVPVLAGTVPALDDTTGTAIAAYGFT